MTRKKVLMLLGSVCLALVLVVPVVAACAGPAPTPTPTPAKPTPTPSPTPTPAPSAAPEVIKWTMQHLEPMRPGFGPYQPYALMAVATFGFRDWFEAASGGRVEIEIVEPDSVFPCEEALTAVGAGAVDCHRGCAMHWSGEMPEMNVVAGMPCSIDSIGQQHDLWYHYGFYEKIRPLYEERNIVFFAIPALEAMNIMTVNIPVPGPDSIKGLTLRAPGAWGKYIELLGGNAVSMPYSDIYMAMKLGTIDGALTSIAALENIKLHEVVTDYVNGPNPCLDCILMNKDSFEALPEDLQDLLNRDLPLYLTCTTLSVWQQYGYAVAHAAEDYGLRIWTWPEEDMKEIRERAIAELWPEYAAATPLSAELVEIVKQQMRDHGKL